MADMALVKNMFTRYECFYMENHDQTMEKMIALNTKQNNQIINLHQLMESKDKEVKAKNLEIKNKNK